MSAGVVLVAVTLGGCATTGKPGPTGTPTPSTIGCDPIVWDKPVPETVRPEDWRPAPGPQPQDWSHGLGRAYVHIRFVTDGEHYYAVGVPVLNLEAKQPFIVGPMEDLRVPLPENEQAARAALAKAPGWSAFYSALFHAFRYSRPMGLVCPGKDCPITPEGPPPQMFGMTVSYGSGGTGALETPEPTRAYALLPEAAARPTATDALRPPAPPAKRSSEQERERLDLVSDVVTRAVCAARILAGAR